MSSSKPARPHQAHLRVRRAALVAVAAAGLAIGLFSAAGGVASAKSTAAPLLVWVDATRIPQIKAFEKANPSVKLDVVTYDGDAGGDGTLQSKFALFNRVGHGWPDVFFSGTNTDAASLGVAPYNDLLQLNKGLVPSSVIKNFAAGSLADCTIGGKLFCLRNDVAQAVLWVNTTEMKQFGYTVPTTWQQYAAIGASVAANHPGYFVGTGGDWFADQYLWSSGCPMDRLVNPTTVEIDPSSPNCTRVATVIDPLLADGSLSMASLFSFTSANADKLLMNVGPSWLGAYVYDGATGGALKVPAGEIAAYPR